MEIKSVNKILFRTLVFISAIVILYYTVGNKIINKQSFTKIQNCIREYSNQNREEEQNYKNSTALFRNKPLPVSTLKVDANSPEPVINSIKLAEINNGEQTVILETNSGITGADVILAAKGMRTKWVFRFKDDDICNGKVLIERFGLAVPVVEKDTELTFAPWKDFSVTCDKGKFNYYIITVDNLDTFISKLKSEENNIQDEIKEKVEKQVIKSSAPDTTQKAPQSADENPQAILKEDINTTILESNSNSSTESNTVKNQMTGKEPEQSEKQPGDAKKGGILDHLFHHH